MGSVWGLCGRVAGWTKWLGPGCMHVRGGRREPKGGMTAHMGFRVL